MHTFRGIVQKGTKRAAALGFSTINISFQDANVSGIYAARVNIGQEEYAAAAFADPKRHTLEAHLLDFQPRELYGEEVTIALVEKVRDSKAFENDADLRNAIASDIEKVRTLV
jgi:riboflavin kinase / FMN adenylyltransferase